MATARVRDVPSSIVLQFAGTFGVWMLAEQLGLSPIITMVIYAMTLAQTAPAQAGPRQPDQLLLRLGDRRLRRSTCWPSC